MEHPNKPFDVVAAAEAQLREAQLVVRPVVLPPFVVSDLFNVVAQEHDRRITEGISEPITEDGPDIVHQLQEKMALTLPLTTSGDSAVVPLNTPEINLIRQLLAEQQGSRDIVKETEYEQDVIAFEAAVADSGARIRPDDDPRLRMATDRVLKKYNVRTSGAIPLQWALSMHLEEEKMNMSPKTLRALREDYELGQTTLKAFEKGRKFDENAEGKAKLMRVILSGQQIDYLDKNLRALKADVGMEVYVTLVDDLVRGLRHNYPTAKVVEAPKPGKLKQLFNRITGQKG